MSMLSRPLVLHGIDVERLMAKVIDRSGTVARLEPRLQPHERDDLLAHLIAVAWRLSLDFKPGRGSVSLSTYVYTIASRRVVDWIRSTRGRSKWVFHDHVHERPRPQMVSLDDDRAGLVEAVAAGSSDPAASSSPDLERMLAAGDRARARDYEILGLRPPRRAA
jgi:DNA-directed RNA polymerase specialized sigma24 family protein